MRFKAGVDPRVLPGHRERGPENHSVQFTYRDLAQWSGRTESAVRKAVSRGTVDLGSFDSIVEFILRKNLRDLVEEARGELEE